jgi:hypothetical protein
VTRGSQPRSMTEPAGTRWGEAQDHDETTRYSALLGSLLGSGHALSLHVPLAAAAAGSLVAAVLAWLAIGREPRSDLRA